MSDEDKQANFDGWGILEAMGHARYAGYVTTEAYGQAVLFRVDVPSLPARERTAKSMEWDDDSGRTIPAGAVIHEGATEAYTKMFGAGSIYCLTPCTEAAAMEAVDAMQRRPVIRVDIQDQPVLAAADSDSDDLPY